MQNIVTEVKGSKLTITIDLKGKTSPSASGKSQIVASTRGNSLVEGTDVMLGLNLYRKV